MKYTSEFQWHSSTGKKKINDLKVDMDVDKIQITQEILSKNSKTGDITSQHFSSNYATDPQQ
jgi:hypothetical protein